MRLASCVTLWDPEQSHEPLLILIHVLIASSIAPLYGHQGIPAFVEPNEA